MSVPRYPDKEKAPVADHNGAGPGCDACLGTGRVGTPIGVILCPDCAVHPVQACINRGIAAGELSPAWNADAETVATLTSFDHPDDAIQGLADESARPLLQELVDNQARQISDLEAKLEAERQLRAQAAADLEREKAHERARRIEADGRVRDLQWALDAAIEAMAPLAGFASEEDGRVAGMTAPVCIAMSSVRRADALVKLHRALRR